MSPKITILLLGGTGACGQAFVHQALTNPDVRVLLHARNPHIFPPPSPDPERLVLLTGDNYTLSPADLASSLALKPDVVVSFLGPPTSEGMAWMSPLNSGAPLFYAPFYANLISEMEKAGVNRLYALSTLSVYDPKDKESFARGSLVWGIWTMARRAWREFVGIGEFFRGLGNECKVDWTVVRVGFLSDGGEEAAVAGYVGDGKTTLKVKRGELAKWMLEEVVSGGKEWVREMPVVSSRAV